MDLFGMSPLGQRVQFWATTSAVKRVKAKRRRFMVDGGYLFVSAGETTVSKKQASSSFSYSLSSFCLSQESPVSLIKSVQTDTDMRVVNGKECFSRVY